MTAATAMATLAKNGDIDKDEEGHLSEVGDGRVSQGGVGQGEVLSQAETLVRPKC